MPEAGEIGKNWKDRFQMMNFDVFYLQLRHYCGMTTPDLRQTLANISTLLCDKLGVTMYV